MKRRLGGTLTLFCLYGAMSAWWLRPVTSHPADTVPGLRRLGLVEQPTLADVYLTLWILAAGAQQLVTDPANLFHPPAFYPERYALAFSEHMLGHQLLFAPVYFSSGNPVLALNVSLLVSTALLALGTHLLIGQWGGGVASRVLGAALVVAAPWRVGSSAVRVHTLWVHYLPFVLLFLDRYLAHQRRRDLAAASACLWLQILTSYYTGYAAAVALAIYLLARVRRRARVVAQAAIGCLAAVAAAAPFTYPYLFVHGDTATYEMTPELVSALLIGRGAPAVLTWHTVGIVPLAASLVLAVPARWLRRGGLTVPSGSLVAIIAAGYVLAAGPALFLPAAPGRGLKVVWDLFTIPVPRRLASAVGDVGPHAHRIPMPYTLLAAAVPGFDRLRAPYRFGVLPATLLPVTAALALERVSALLLTARALPALAVTAVTLARIPAVIAMPVEVGDGIPPAYKWLRANGAGRPLLEVPFGGQWHSYPECRAMYFATFHRLPLLNGSSASVPETFIQRVAIAARLPARDAVAELCAETGLGWLLLHRDRLSPPARRAWDLPLPALRPAATFGDDIVFSVRCDALEDSIADDAELPLRGEGRVEGRVPAL